MLKLLIMMIVAHPGVSPDHAFQLLSSSPTWTDWNGRNRVIEKKLIVTLRSLSHLDTKEIIESGRRYLRHPGNTFAKQTLLYLVGRYIFDIPFVEYHEYEQNPKQSPQGSFRCQPIAIDSSGEVRLLYIFGTYRGPGYEFESDFRRLDAQFGRRHGR